MKRALALLAIVPLLATAQVEDRGPTCIALAVYSEARSESWEGQAAVAQVVLNRQAQLPAGSDACDAVLEPSQFEGVDNWHAPRIANDKVAWAQARAVAEAMITHDYYLPPPLQTAIYFRAHSGSPAPKCNGVPFLGTVGAHDFYGPKTTEAEKAK